MLEDCPDDIISGPPNPAVPPSDSLAHAFLKGLAQRERERRKHEAMGGSVAFVDDDDPVERMIAQDEPDRKTEHVPLPPGRALTAVLVARAIEADPDVLRRLRRENPIVTVATHTPGPSACSQGICRAR